jgi:class 3 adenylate cyclase/tetratricopeptide (TPR) repeat protein
MKCRNCQKSNPEGAQFCMYCGTPMRRVCANCGADLPAEARFCLQCGHPVDPGPKEGVDAAEAVPDWVNKYLPAGLIQKLERARSNRAMVGERRVVSILFCDVKGSTAAAHDLDPEEWAEIMNGAFEYLIEPVYRYEGTLARMMGDAILAFFGAPIAHEDDPERAVLAGLDMQSGIARYAEQVQQRWGLAFNVRVGINTGLVVVGEVGSDLRVEYTALGDAINLAARMEETAEPGSVQISAETYRLVSRSFEAEPVGPLEVRGRPEPLRAFRVLGPKHLGAGTGGADERVSPLVGRESEMAVLRGSLEKLWEGHGGVLCLIGEAGLGKSRLLRELYQRAVNDTADRQTVTWTESRSLSYQSARPYGLFQQHVRQICDIRELESEESARQRIADCLGGLPMEQRQSVAEALTAMLGMDQGEGESEAQAEALKHRIFEANRQLWRHQANQSPLVAAFDDLHWADPASIELLIDLFQLSDSVPILFLCAFRPDRQAPSWRVKQEAEIEYPHRYQELLLQPLSDETTRSLLGGLLATRDFPADVLGMIEAKAEGNPLFVEEILKELIEDGVLVHGENGNGWERRGEIGEIAIPDNLQALFVARIDRLQEEIRRTLQLAAVIGRTFYYRVLEAIAGGSSELDRHLNALQRMELVREASRMPELEYTFRHALAQEAAYRSILRKQRRTFHRQVADAIERLFPERLEEFAPLLAFHFHRAGDQRGLKYAIMAGDAAFRLYALPEALEQYSLALEFAGSEDLDSEQLRHLFMRRGRAFELMAAWDRALENYRRMERLATQRGDPDMRLAALIPQATVRSTVNRASDQEEGRRLLQEAQSLASELGDERAESKLLWTLMLNNVSSGGSPEERIRYGERSLALARKHNLKEQVAFTLHDLWFGYAGVGRWEQARRALKESAEFWREVNNLPMLAENLSRTYMTQMGAGEYDQALISSDEAYRVAEEGNNPEGRALARAFIGGVHFDRGDMGKAIAVMEQAISIGEPVGTVTVTAMTKPILGWVLGSLGRQERGIEIAEQALHSAEELLPAVIGIPAAVLAYLHLRKGETAAAEEYMRLTGGFREQHRAMGFMPHLWGLIALVEAELHLATGNPAAAVKTMGAFDQICVDWRMRQYLTDARYLLARGYRALGEEARATAALEQAASVGRSVGCRRVLWRVLEMQAEILQLQGDEDQAAALRAEAAGIVAFIADHIPDPEMKRAFLDGIPAAGARNP